MRKRKPISALVLLAALGLASLALATEAPTRAAYVDQLEAICKPGSQQTERAVRGVKGDLKAERLRRAAAKFAAAGRIFSANLDQISVIPRPRADRPKLATWFGYLGQQQRYLGRIAAHLRAGRTIASQHATARFVHNGDLANRTVIAFGFHYCSFDFARFG